MQVKRKLPYGRRRRRGIFIIPSLITLTNMFFGFYAIIQALKGNYALASYLIICAGFLDFLDGIIARMTKTQTDFGSQLDSLSDLTSFGMVPALMAYLYSLNTMGRMGWLLAFLYTACGAIRLARFNVLTTRTSEKYFIGLPITVAGGAMGILILNLPPDNPLIPYIVFGISCMMVSNFPYPSSKMLNTRSMRPTYTLLILVLIIVIVAHRPIPALTFMAVIYLFSGPLIMVRSRLRKEAVPDNQTDDV